MWILFWLLLCVYDPGILHQGVIRIIFCKCIMGDDWTMMLTRKPLTRFHFSFICSNGIFFYINILKPIYVKGSAITWQILSNDSPPQWKVFFYLLGKVYLYGWKCLSVENKQGVQFQQKIYFAFHIFTCRLVRYKYILCVHRRHISQV